MKKKFYLSKLVLNKVLSKKKKVLKHNAFFFSFNLVQHQMMKLGVGLKGKRIIIFDG